MALWLVFAAIGFIWLLISGRNALSKVTNIATYASRAGWTGEDLVTAVAIAWAESSGDPNARGDETTPGDPSTATSYGLWQIHWTVHPEAYQPEDDPTVLFEPQRNAIEAFRIYTRAGRTFRDWSTFDPRNGSTPRYLSYLDKARQEVSA